jgi:hypothetical protein
MAFDAQGQPSVVLPFGAGAAAAGVSGLAFDPAAGALYVVRVLGGSANGVLRVGAQSPPAALCAGDGSGAACPCGNAGLAGRGCANSAEPGGAALASSGLARVSSDSLLLAARHLTPGAAALFVQGSSVLRGGLGVPFGDGLRCAGGTQLRLGLRQAVSGVAQIGAPAGGAPLSALGSIPATGGVAVYQVWYRDVWPYCTSATFNLTNGLRVTWIP